MIFWYWPGIKNILWDIIADLMVRLKNILPKNGGFKQGCPGPENFRIRVLWMLFKEVVQKLI